MSRKRTLYTLALTALAVGLLFTACGAVNSLYTHATIIVSVVQAR